MIMMSLFNRGLELALIFVPSLLISFYLGFIYGNRKKENIQDKQLLSINKAVTDSERDDLHIRQSVINKIETLKNRIATDFVGLAFYDFLNGEIRWRLAAGATNTRYKKIVIRLGKGIAGEVVQLNRTVRIEDYPYDVIGDPIEYPILLVEHIKSAIAVPVADDLRIYGVLLAGQRSNKHYNEEEEKIIKETSRKLAKELAIANIYSRIRDEKTDDITGSKQEYINDSIFVQYLMKQQNSLTDKKRGKLEFEVLDQSIVELPEQMQQVLIRNMEDLLRKINKQQSAQVKISISREESNLLIESYADLSFSADNNDFDQIYQRTGEIGGSIISYHEDDSFHFIMQIPLWNFNNPILS